MATNKLLNKESLNGVFAEIKRELDNIPQNVSDLEDADDYATKEYTDARTIGNVTANVEVGGEVKQATVTKDGSDVHIDFPDLQGKQGVRGNGITSITQTTVATEDGSKNIVNIKTTDNPQGVNIEIKNGSQGIPGADRQPVEAGDVIITHTTGQDEGKVMSQKAVTDAIGKYGKYIDGEDTTTYENSGEIEYYTDFNSGYSNAGVMQHTNEITVATKVNRVLIGPIRGKTAGKAKYYIKRGSWDYRTTPANLTTIKSGEIDLTTSFQQFEIELDEVVELENERLYVYFGATTISKAILGTNGEVNAPSQYTGEKTTFLAMYCNNSSTIDTTWLVATGNRYAVQPILKLVLQPEVNDDIDARIELARQSIVDEASERAEEVNDELHEFKSDTDITIKEDGEIEFYEQYNYGYGNAAVAQCTKTKTEAYKITSVVVGPVKGVGVSEATYYIVVVANSGRNNITNGTTIKTGTVSISTTFTQHTFDLGEEVTVPIGSVVAVYFIRKTGGGNIIILGNNNTAGATRNGTPIVMYGGSATGNWNYGNSGYVAVQPILKYHKDSGCKTLIKDEVENAKPGLIEAMGEAIEGKVEELLPDIKDDVEEAIDSVDVYLPDKIVAVVGDVLEIFWRSIIKAVDPYAYDIYVECAKGNNLPKKFYYSPNSADVGSEILTVKVKNRNGNLVGTATTTLVTVAAPQSPVENLNVFCIGDSLTSGGQWPCEAKRRLTSNFTIDDIQASNLSNITFCGKKEITYDYGNNKSITSNCYGHGGWVWYDYQKAASPQYRVSVSGVGSVSVDAKYTNNGKTFTVKEVNVTAGTGTLLLDGSGAPTNGGTLTRTSGSGDAEIAFTSYEVENENPLWDSAQNKFTFEPYVDMYGNGSIDVLYVLLSWNGQSAWKSYSASATTGQIGYAKTFINKLHEEYPNAKVKVLGLQMPSPYGGLGQNYGTNTYTQRFGLFVCAWNYNKALQDLCNLDAYSDFCEFVDVATQFDSENNMPGGQSKANKRNTVTYYQQTNGVHPSNPGYFQIADVVYRNFVANYCQSE